MAGTISKIPGYLLRGARWSLKWLPAAGLAAICSWYGYKVTYVDPYRKGSVSQKIQPPEGDGIYNGGWINHCADKPHIGCYENKFGQKVDILFRFINFRELKPDKPFPEKEAAAMKERGGALYLELEPDMGAGMPDLLEKILKGHYDKELEAFAKGAGQGYNGPVFLSFGHEMNVDTHPWGMRPELYVKAYRYVHDKISHWAPNVTWVWNPYLGENLEKYYPGDNYVDWIGISFFHHSGESVSVLSQRIEKCLAALKKHGKPLMISRFGSSAGELEKAQFFGELLPNFERWGIKGFNYFNFFELTERGTLSDFLIQGEEAVQGYRDALLKLNLEGNIVTRDGELRGRETPPPENCEEIEQTFINAYKIRAIEDLKTFIANREALLDYISVSHDENALRLQTATAYRELYRIYHYLKLEDQAQENIQKAQHHLAIALANPDNTVLYHPSKPYIKEYFELRLELADLHSELENYDEALDLIGEIKHELSDWETTLAQDVRPESVPGYQNRSNLLRAQILERKGEASEAKKLYIAVDNWASGEQAEGSLSLWWAGESQNKLRFIATMARLGLARIEINELYGIAPEAGKLDIQHILKSLEEILKWEEAGKEVGGFMDRNFEAHLYAMEACLLSSENLDEAKAIFNGMSHWEELNQREDFKRALQIEGVNLADPSVDRWETILRGLSRASIEDEMLEGILTRLKEASGI